MCKFTVKAGNIDGSKSRFFQAEEVQFDWKSVETYEELENALARFKDQGYAYGEWRNLWIPQNEKAFRNAKREIGKNFREDYSGNASSDQDPLDDVRVRVGHIELFDKPGYRSICVFNARLYLMNADGQTVEKLNLLR